MDTEVSQEHHGRTSQCTKSTRNLIRDKIINQSKEWSPYVLESQQTCSLSDNLSILQGRETVFNDPRRKEKLRGLQAILQEMLLEEPFDVNNQKKVGFMAFDDAFALYMGFQSTQDFSHQAKYNFQCAILHPNTGLCVNILVIPGSREKVIILCPDRSLDFTFLYDFLVKHFYSDRKEEFTKEEIDIVLDSVTSEWDKQVVKYILCRTRTAEEMKLLGVKQETTEKIRDRVPLVLEEVRHSSAVVNNEVSENISNKIEKLESKIQAKKKLLLRKSKSWTKVRQDELQDEIEACEDRVKELQDLQVGKSKSHRQRLQQMRRRRAKRHLLMNRVGKRKLGGQGRKPLIDSDTEEQIAKAIEDKATYHGRRHNTTMYTNRRVKVADLPLIANHFLSQKGKRLVRSKTTVWNRSEPRRKNSRQAKLHLGKGYFCTRKPPKTESSENESTHHQRAHVNNVKMFFFSNKMARNRKYCFCRSIDDKAYIRPGTCEAMNNARNQRILTPSAEERARKLPLHDWPQQKVNITPSAHRIFTKVGQDIDGSEKLITEEDEHFVFVRPKFYVGSSGTVWANETMRLRYLYPDIFEVKEDANGEEKYHPSFRSICAQLHDAAFLFMDMSEQKDIERAKAGDRDNPHTQYERKRLTRLKARIQEALDDNFEQIDNVGKTVFAARVQPLVQDLTSALTEVDRYIEDPRESCSLLEKIQFCVYCCRKLLDCLEELELPPIKPRWCDLTDAGPGVGVSNLEVRFRDAEMARIWNSDYRIRVHRAREDSGQEDERTNAAVGDAVIDGGTIKWDYFQRFDDLSDEEVQNMTLSSYEQYEDNRMERNAWRVSQDIASRIDDAPVLSSYIKSLVTEKEQDSFFFNKDQLQEFGRASDVQKQNVTGYHYFSKISGYIDSHYEKGELYMEFLKDGCTRDAGKPCTTCSSGWIGPVMERIPRPFPDETTFKYKSVFESPGSSAEDEPRPPDDFLPRAQIKSWFGQGNLDSEEKIAEFSKRFIVPSELVKSYIDHLKHLNYTKQLRSVAAEQERQRRKDKKYEEYNWEELLLTGGLKLLYVFELDKYLKHHSLPWRRKLKEEKVLIITAHVHESKGSSLEEVVVTGKALLRPVENPADSEESESEEEILFETSSYPGCESTSCSSQSSASGDESESDVDLPVRIPTNTRSGRKSTRFLF